MNWYNIRTFVLLSDTKLQVTFKQLITGAPKLAELALYLCK